MDKKSMLLQIIARLQTESPDFFKNIQKYSIYIILLAGIPMGLELFGIIAIPVKIEVLLMAIITYFTGTGVTATLPVKTMDGPGGKIPDPGNPKPPGGS